MWPLGNVSTLGQCNASLSSGGGREWGDTAGDCPQQWLTRQMSGVAARISLRNALAWVRAVATN